MSHLPSQFGSKQSRDRMEFTKNWGEGPVFDWYRELKASGCSTTIARLQIHIEGNQPPHRFILAYMQDERVLRFDRRPGTSKPGTLVLETFFSRAPRRAADSLVKDKEINLEELLSKTQREFDLSIPSHCNADLLLLLSACFAISNDNEAHKYGLLSYNCYFFAWTVTMLVIRHALPLDIPPVDAVANRLTHAISDLSASLTNKIITILLGIVLDTVVEFRAKTGRKLNKGLGKRELLVWGLPTDAVRFLLRQCLKIRIHLGLEEKLKDRVIKELNEKMPPLLKDVLDKQREGGKTLNMKQNLWIDDLTDVVRPVVESHLIDIVWDSILDVIGSGQCDLKQGDFIRALQDSPSIACRLKFRVMGSGILQFTRLWNEALHAALPAAGKVARGRGKLVNYESKEAMHCAMFDLAFTEARKKALEAAQRVTRETNATVKNRKREDMWNVVWGVWDDVWKIAKDKAQVSMLSLLEEAVEQIVLLVAQSVVAAVGANPEQQLQAIITHQSHKTSTSQEKSISLGEFQTNIMQSVESAYPNTTKQQMKEIQQAMTRIWHDSEKSYKPLELTQTVV